MPKNLQIWRPLTIFGLAAAVLLGYQNCSSKVAFRSNSSLVDLGGPGGVICNPLDPSAGCDITVKDGLVGNIYYLLPEQKNLFNDDLNNAMLADYIQYGYKVSNPVLMSRVNVPPQAWDAGFAMGNGELVKDLNGNELFEWFSLDLHGFMTLPAGSYQLGILSDDGMQVILNNTPAIVDDGVHSPRWKCSDPAFPVTYSADEKKKIDVQYFQGPRVDIAMQMFVRPVADVDPSKPCDKNSDWSEIPATAFSH